MKKIFVLAFLLAMLQSHSQSVFGYWYGNANVKTRNSANNYLVELVLQPEKGYVKGVLNYFFRNTYRSLQVKGNYNTATRQLSLYNIPITYFGSFSNLEVDCTMNMLGTLRVAKRGSKLIGAFIGLPEYKHTCADINFSLTLNAGISKKDSVLKAIRQYKEEYQVWRPSASDTLTAINVGQRNLVNYVIEKQFKERVNVVTQEIEVASDSVKVDIYDNGEIDGDSVSVFFNNKLLVSSQILSERAIHFDLALNSNNDINDLSMFADNLGSIPPNTALMIVEDGKKEI